MKKIIETTVKETDDYKIVKCFDEIGNEWATKITTYNVECKYCDYVQIQNRGDGIIYHLRNIHQKEYKD